MQDLTLFKPSSHFHRTPTLPLLFPMNQKMLPTAMNTASEAVEGLLTSF